MTETPFLSQERQEGQRTALSVSLPVEPYGVPVKGTKDTFLIEWEIISPETVISIGRDLTERERRITLKYFMLKQGATCWAKGEPLVLDEVTNLPIADVHHFKRLANGRRLHKMKEMALCCHKHNARAGKPPMSTPTVREKMQEQETANPNINPTVQLHQLADYQRGSPEMIVNDLCEVPWQNWIYRQVKLNKRITKHDAINQGAWQTGWNPQSARRAYDKTIFQPRKSAFKDTTQPFFEERDPETRIDYVYLRDGFEPSLVDLPDGRQALKWVKVPRSQPQNVEMRD